MSADVSEVQVDQVNFKLGEIIAEWAKDHGWHVLGGGGSPLPPDYYVEVAHEPLDQDIGDLRIVFYKAED